MSNYLLIDNTSAEPPTVSVAMLTYNHQNYIAEAIESVLMQQTSFKVKLIIAEDFSLDTTRQIVLDYQKKYPDKIKLILQNENVGASKNNISLFENLEGKYIAALEGDDYWTDQLKLQKQVGFLEENGDCSLCFHGANYINNNSEIISIHRPLRIPDNYKFGMKDAILGGGGFITTNSMVFHAKYIKKIPSWMDDAPVGDIPLMLVLASKGKIGYIDQIMSVYRVASLGSWSSVLQIDRVKSKIHHYKIDKMWEDFDDWTNKRYHKLVLWKKFKNSWNYHKSNLKFLIKKNFKLN